MAWYYSENGAQAGPIDEPTFNSLVSAGRITPETLVWREGMEAWAAYSTVASGTSPAAPSIGGALPRCSECGNVFPADELVQIGSGSVCAACKPIAVQKLKEGVIMPKGFRYAGFWIRFAAWFVDFIILWVFQVVFSLISAIFIHTPPAGEKPNPFSAVSVVLMIISFGVQAGYYIWFVGKYGGTPGKMACGLRIVRADGEPVSFGRATGRYFSQMLSGMILVIGYIMAAFDDQKRALHDRICDTRVIYK